MSFHYPLPIDWNQQFNFSIIDPICQGLPLKADFGPYNRKTGQLKMNERFGVHVVNDSDNDFSLLVVNEENISINWLQS